MKTRLFYILSLLCLGLGFGACNQDDAPTIELSQTEIMNIPSEGGSYDIRVHSDQTWTVKESDLEWITMARYTNAKGEQMLKLEVQSNLSEVARFAELEVLNKEDKSPLRISQQGKPAGQELKYRIPLVFHVLYYDPSDKDQNIETSRLYEVLKEVNALYAQNGINLEFYPAAIDPSGEVMAAPGVDRIQWVSSTINPIEVMKDEENEFLHLLWDPNRYVNVLLYPFSYENILGIATFPLTPEHQPMVGLDPVKFSNLSAADLKQLRGVSINSTWFRSDLDEDNPFKAYVSADLLKRQVSIATTVAHELGHYLGLRHVFAEGPEGSCVDTDFCSDTPSYDKRVGYDAFVSETMSEAVFNPYFKNDFDWKTLFQRTNCDGVTFESRNIMDYSYSYMDTFTAGQKERIRHVLSYSPFIPGPKKTVVSTIRSTTLPIRPSDIPYSTVICRVGEDWVKSGQK